MPAPLRLFLLRHGQVASNRELRYVGARDEPLTDLGQRQAEQAAEALAPLEIERVVTSPLRRARETASRVAAKAALPLVVDERLREQSFGSWEGLSRTEVKERSSEDRAALAAWEGDPTLAPPGGESLASVQRRVVALVAELAEECARDALRRVVLVSHVGPIKAIFAAALDVPLDRARRIFLDPGTISVVDWAEPPILRLCNSHAHAGWANARWMALPTGQGQGT